MCHGGANSQSFSHTDMGVMKVLSLFSEPEVLATANSSYNGKCCHSAMNQRSWQQPIPATTESVVTLL